MHTLYVAPRKGGGFCYLWTNADGGCLSAKAPSKTRAMRAMGPLGISWFSNGYAAGYPLFVDGWVRSGATKTVEARFADGTHGDDPRHLGFGTGQRGLPHLSGSTGASDARRRPHLGRRSRRRRQGHRETELPADQAARSERHADAAGRNEGLASAARAGSPRPKGDQLPHDGRLPSLRLGDAAHRRRRLLPLQPRQRLPGTALRQAQTPTLNGGFSGSTNPPLLFFVQAKPQVATVELRYQNGESERLTPIDGFVLHEITPAHYKRGTRLVAAVALDRSGKAIYTERFQPRSTSASTRAKHRSTGPRGEERARDLLNSLNKQPRLVHRLGDGARGAAHRRA